jgi:hypothetical protein
VPRWDSEPPLLGGRHQLLLNHDVGWRSELAIETESLGARHCDRVKLGWPRAWEREPFWFGDVRLAFTGVLSELSFGGLRLLLARWSGPLRLGVELGLINAITCDEERGECPAPFALPLGFEASVSRGFGSGLFLDAGMRFTTLFAEEQPGRPLALRAFLLQATGEVLVGNDLQPHIDPAPAGSTVGLGAEAGPAIILGSKDKLGFALGFHLSYAYAP